MPSIHVRALWECPPENLISAYLLCRRLLPFSFCIIVHSLPNEHYNRASLSEPHTSELLTASMFGNVRMICHMSCAYMCEYLNASQFSNILLYKYTWAHMHNRSACTYVVALIMYVRSWRLYKGGCMFVPGQCLGMRLAITACSRNCSVEIESGIKMIGAGHSKAWSKPRELPWSIRTTAWDWDDYHE